NMVLTPARCACWGEPAAQGLPSNWMEPRSRRNAPLRILIIVDLPAPFWPTRAMTSAGMISRCAADSAETLPKDLSIALMDKSGSTLLISYEPWPFGGRQGEG